MPPVTADEYDLEHVLRVWADSRIRNLSTGILLSLGKRRCLCCEFSEWDTFDLVSGSLEPTWKTPDVRTQLPVWVDPCEPCLSFLCVQDVDISFFLIIIHDQHVDYNSENKLVRWERWRLAPFCWWGNWGLVSLDDRSKIPRSISSGHLGLPIFIF